MLYPPPHTASPFSTSLTRMIHFFPKGEPTLTNHYHPKSTVYLRVCSSCCIFYKHRQIHNDIYPSLRIVQSIFTVLHIRCALFISSSPALQHHLWQLLICLLSPYFCLFQSLIQLASYSI